MDISEIAINNQFCQTKLVPVIQNHNESESNATFHKKATAEKLYFDLIAKNYITVLKWKDSEKTSRCQCMGE